MGKKRRRRDGEQSRHARRAAGPLDGMQITTPEGDEIVIATVRYRHSSPKAIFVIFQAAEDFDVEGDPEIAADWDPDGDQPLMFVWLETRPEAPELLTLAGQRILASVTLTRTRLEAEAMSQSRLDACRERLDDLLGDGIRLLETRTKSLEQAMGEASPIDLEEPLLPPAEVLAEIEERMLREWIDESIPALGGLTPREAVKTPEGREKVLELIETGERMGRAAKQFPGSFAPDYGKVREMLDLE